MNPARSSIFMNLQAPSARVHHNHRRDHSKMFNPCITVFLCIMQHSFSLRSGRNCSWRLLLTPNVWQAQSTSPAVCVYVQLTPSSKCTCHRLGLSGGSLHCKQSKIFLLCIPQINRLQHSSSLRNGRRCCWRLWFRLMLHILQGRKYRSSSPCYPA